MYSNHCDKDVTQTNLLLAQLLMKTTDEKTKLTENPSLLSVIQSLSTSSELYLSRSTPLQRTEGNVVVSRAIDDSDSSNCYSSISSLPSSVHVTDVTHDKCHAYEHPACHGVSVTANETNVSNSIIVSEGSEGPSSLSASSTSLPRKRPAGPLNDSMLLPSPSKRSQYSNGVQSSNGAITTPSELLKYIKETQCVTKQKLDEEHDAFDNGHDTIDLYQYVQRLIQLCDHDALSYVNHSVVILEHICCSNDSSKMSRLQPETASDDDTKSRHVCTESFFVNNTIQCLIVVERPSTKRQVYVVAGLRKKFHFSCPTMFIPTLFEAIKRINNPDLELMFIPRYLDRFQINSCLQVFNNLDDLEEERNEDIGAVYDAITGRGSYPSSRAMGKTSKRSRYSLSIGLQTMYSHQQHLARYCMLPHSKPHVTTVRDHPTVVRDTVLSVYNFATETIQNNNSSNTGHPFLLSNVGKECSTIGDRMLLRNELRSYLSHGINSTKIDDSVMFESCTVQPTASLGFHQDSMNCPEQDYTIACFIPCRTSQCNADSMKCLSFLYYARKCVNDHVKRMSNIEQLLNNPKACKLTQLCIKSMMHNNCNFDYQGSLFEVTPALNSLAKEFETKHGYRSKEVEEYTGLSCFKHGAAFDKMGYYSIFMNIFCSLHYLGFITNIDDSISLCIYFGFLCNGTSSLAAVWKELESKVVDAMKYYNRKTFPTKLFEILVRLDRHKQVKCNKHKEKDRNVCLLGNCKLPRFQYANYGTYITDESATIHGIVKKFLSYRSGPGAGLTSNRQHSYLYSQLKSVKGIGPLSYNQFWHSLCLCGVLPHSYIESSAIGLNSGPAKLVQVFYPNLKSEAKLSKKLSEIRIAISNLGMTRVTDFFLENMLCELWRIAGERNLFTKNMSEEDMIEIFMSSRFQSYIMESKVTRRPDIYYSSPFTKDYQHLFRVSENIVYMRPSFLKNDIGHSIQLQCSVTFDEDEVCKINWKGEFLRGHSVSPSDMFIDRSGGN